MFKRISSPFPSFYIFFPIDSLHAIHSLPNLKKEKKSPILFTRTKMVKPSQTASNAIQQFFSPRQQIYTAKWPGIINPTPANYSPRFQKSLRDGTSKIQQRFNEDVWNGGGGRNVESKLSTCPDRGSGRTKLSPKWKKGKADKSGVEGWFLTGTRFPVDLDVFVEIRFHEAVSDGPEEERKEPRDPLWRTALCDPIPPGDLDSWLVPLRVWSL